MSQRAKVQMTVYVSQRARDEIERVAYEEGTSDGAIVRRHLYAGLRLTQAGDESLRPAPRRSRGGKS
jgi:hypothetical protein